MDFPEFSGTGGAPPPPPIPPTRTPPASPSDKQQNIKPPPRSSPSQRPPLNPSMQGSFRRGSSGRGRAGSNTSNDLIASLSQSLSRKGLGSDEMQQLMAMPADAPPAATDRNLIWASLDNHAVEDEAEATLLDVLERHQQVTFANQGVRRRPPHRRHRTAYSDALPNIELLNLDTTTERPTSAPSSSEASQPLQRPSLPSRSISHGRSRRNLIQRPAVPTRAATGGGDWAFNEHGELLHAFSESSEQLEGADIISDSGPGEGINRAPSHESPEKVSAGKRWAFASAQMKRNHQRNATALPTTLPMGFDRGISESSQSSGLSSGLSTPAERARFVALTMKAKAEEEMEDPTLTAVGGNLTDLMQILEEKREFEDSSRGSQKSKSKSSRSRMSSRISAEGISRMSSRISAESISRGSKGASSGFSGGFRTHRPFSGVSASPFSNDDFMNSIDQMFQVAVHVEELCQIPEEEDQEEGTTMMTSTALANENSNFLSNLVNSHPDIPEISEGDTDGTPNVEGGAIDEQTPMLQKKENARFKTFSPRRTGALHLWSVTQPTPGSRFYKILVWWTELRQHMKILRAAFNAPYVKEVLSSFIQNQLSLFVLPALAISAFFYYRLNNPSFAVLPTDASISWWILFVVRNYLTLQLAYVLEYLFVDVLACSSPFSVQIIGPLATLYTINAKGWPFVLTTWSLLNFALNQEGHNTNTMFFSHWFYFTEIEMFTDANPTGGIVQSDTYDEILIAMIIAGVATSIKRTLLALYLGKRIYIHYKPKLEKVMETMILLTEVAELGEAIDEHEFEFQKVNSQDAPEQRESRKSMSTRASSLQDKIRTSTMIAVVNKPKMKKVDSDSDEDDSEDESKGSSNLDTSPPAGSTPWNRLRTGSESSGENQPLDKDDRKPSQGSLEKTMASEKEIFADDANLKSEDTPTQGVTLDELPFMANAANTQEENLEDLPFMENGEPPFPAIHEPVQGLLRHTSTTTHIKGMLDDWEEPVNKADKITDPTIHELLQFRKCLPFLNDTHPFGSAFGPAHTRDSCIKSAKSLYRRLLALSPGAPVLNFDIIGVLAYNVDGTFDDKKAKSLVRFFRPDKYDSVSLLHFVQSCDIIYKRIRLLRASVGNSTLIDSVLENIFNAAFFFFLGLTIMSVLQLNPWTLLVSLSTVLVSFAFALGPSVAKIIEGMIMIAVRRPFDLGDRISIVDCIGAPDNSDDPGYHDTWIVEDCNLFTTTLRLSRTNEVSTINNGSIANTRIVNHGRSFNAMVSISLRLDIAATHDQVMILKSAMEQYIRDNPRVWVSLNNFRITHVDPSNDLITYSARIQHVKSWQDLLPILQARGDFEKFCQEILLKLDIHYPCASTTNDVYIKEMPMPMQDMYPEENEPFPDDPIE